LRGVAGNGPEVESVGEPRINTGYYRYICFSPRLAEMAVIGPTFPVVRGILLFSQKPYCRVYTWSPNRLRASRITFSSPTAMIAERWAGKYFFATASTSAAVVADTFCPEMPI
jgi:hypothetical protein